MKQLAAIALAMFGPLATSAAEPATIRCIEPSATSGTSRAVVVGNELLVHTSQILPADTSVGPDKQAAQVLSALDETLRAAQSGLGFSAKLNIYAADEAAASAALAAIQREFTKPTQPPEIKPAVSIVLSRLPTAAAVAMDAVAISHVNEDSRVSLRSWGAARRIAGSEHMAILPPGRKIFVAGQAEKADDVKSATQKTMESLAKTLQFLGRTKEDIVQLKCFVKPVTVESAKEVEAGMKAVLGDGPLPPVVLVEWVSPLPIEIELVAWGGPIEAAMPAVEYLTPPGMTASPIYSRVVRTASVETIYVSGLFGKEGMTPKEETEELFAQLAQILKSSGSDLRHLAKATYYVATDDASSKLNALRPNYYDPQRPPAASKAMVRGVGIKGKTTTLDMIAVPAR